MLPAKPDDRRLYVAMLGNFVVFGISMTIVGATVPEIIRQFNWSYLSMGLVVASPPVGYFISTFLSGVLLGRTNAGNILVGGLALQGAGLLVFGNASGVILNSCLAFMMGIGQGSTEVVTNFCVVQMEEGRQSRLINLMHGALPLGAVTGPLFMGWIFLTGGRWQWMYRGLGLLTLALAGILFLFSYDRFMVDQVEESPESVKKSINRKLLILLGGVMLLFVGAEMGVSAWISEYFVKVLGSGTSVGAWMVSVFWLGVLLGRVAMSFYRGSEQGRLLLLLGFSATVLLSISVSASEMPVASAGFLLTGLGFSAIYPIVTAISGHCFARTRSIAMGTVAGFGGLGSFLFPLIISYLAGTYGLKGGFWFCVFSSAAGLILAMVTVSRFRDTGALKI